MMLCTIYLLLTFGGEVGAEMVILSSLAEVVYPKESQTVASHRHDQSIAWSGKHGTPTVGSRESRHILQSISVAVSTISRVSDLPLAMVWAKQQAACTVDSVAISKVRYLDLSDRDFRNSIRLVRS